MITKTVKITRIDIDARQARGQVLTMIMMMIGSRMIIITIITLIIVILFRELDLDLSAKEKTIVQRLDGTLGVTLVDFDEGLRVKCFWKRVESNRIKTNQWPCF